MFVARSTDGGRTWEDSVELSGTLTDNRDAAIAAGNGRVVVAFSANDEGRSIFVVSTGDWGRSWTAPVVSEGTLYIRNEESLAAIDLR